MFGNRWVLKYFPIQNAKNPIVFGILRSCKSEIDLTNHKLLKLRHDSNQTRQYLRIIFGQRWHNTQQTSSR